MRFFERLLGSKQEQFIRSEHSNDPDLPLTTLNGPSNNPLIQHEEIPHGFSLIAARAKATPSQIQQEVLEIINPPWKEVDRSFDASSEVLHLTTERRGTTVTVSVAGDSVAAQLIASGFDPDNVPEGLYHLSTAKLQGLTSDVQNQILNSYFKGK